MKRSSVFSQTPQKYGQHIMLFLSWWFCACIALSAITVNPAPSWTSISNDPRPKSLSWFCQQEIITSLISPWYLYVPHWIHQSYAAVYYTELYAYCVLSCLFCFLWFCLYFKEKDSCYQWISSSYGGDLNILKINLINWLEFKEYLINFGPCVSLAILFFGR